MLKNEIMQQRIIPVLIGDDIIIYIIIILLIILTGINNLNLIRTLIIGFISSPSRAKIRFVVITSITFKNVNTILSKIFNSIIETPYLYFIKITFLCKNRS